MVRKSQPARLVISPVCFLARGKTWRGGGNSVRQYEASATGGGKASWAYVTERGLRNRLRGQYG